MCGSVGGTGSRLVWCVCRYAVAGKVSQSCYGCTMKGSVLQECKYDCSQKVSRTSAASTVQLFKATMLPVSHRMRGYVRSVRVQDRRPPVTWASTRRGEKRLLAGFGECGSHERGYANSRLASVGLRRRGELPRARPEGGPGRQTLRRPDSSRACSHGVLVMESSRRLPQCAIHRAPVVLSPRCDVSSR